MTGSRVRRHHLDRPWRGAGRTRRVAQGSVGLGRLGVGQRAVRSRSVTTSRTPAPSHLTTGDVNSAKAKPTRRTGSRRTIPRVHLSRRLARDQGPLGPFDGSVRARPDRQPARATLPAADGPTLAADGATNASNHNSAGRLDDCPASRDRSTDRGADNRGDSTCSSADTEQLPPVISRRVHPAAPPDLDCGDVEFRRFTVVPPDPHGFDGDSDGVGCESG